MHGDAYPYAEQGGSIARPHLVGQGVFSLLDKAIPNSLTGMLGLQKASIAPHLFRVLQKGAIVGATLLPHVDDSTRLNTVPLLTLKRAWVCKRCTVKSPSIDSYILE